MRPTATQVPTVRPSTSAPTAEPTLTPVVNVVLSAPCSQTFDGISVDSFQNNNTVQDAFKRSVIDNVDSDGVVTVKTTGVSDATSGPVRDRQRRLANSLQIPYNLIVQIIVTNGNNVDMATLTNKLIGNLTTQLQSSTFATSLQQSLAQSNLAVFVNIIAQPAQVATITYQLILVTNSPTRAPTSLMTKKDKNGNMTGLSRSTLVIIVVVVIAVILAILFFIFTIMFRSSQRKIHIVVPTDGGDSALYKEV